MFINFEPGDATRYIVGLSRISEGEQDSFPGAEVGDYVFSFGTGGGPVTTFSFPGNYPIEFGHYHNYMWRGNASPIELYTLTAGWIVLQYLMGQSGRRVQLAEQIKDKWNTQVYAESWQKQLDRIKNVKNG